VHLLSSSYRPHKALYVHSSAYFFQILAPPHTNSTQFLEKIKKVLKKPVYRNVDIQENNHSFSCAFLTHDDEYIWKLFSLFQTKNPIALTSLDIQRIKTHKKHPLIQARLEVEFLSPP
jgi:hypothetical protein